jgi:CubicO group peptidase (beta-lactamase class C family)
MKRIILLLLVFSGIAGHSTSQPNTTETQALMKGKIDTGRSIQFELVVNASRSKVFQLWTTEKGLASFFAPRAKVDLRVGGAYEMIFAPDLDPQGENQGTKGARILHLEQDSSLAFEWKTFVFEKHPSGLGPPVVSKAVRDERPIPTWVEITLEDISGRPGTTRLRLVHRGFRSGGPWDQAYPYFWRQWGAILGRLGAVCRDAPDTGNKTATLETKVDSYLQPYVSSLYFSGTVLIARENKILINKGYGYADFENDVPNTSGTRFQIASISKTFTSAATLILRDRGLLHLDDTIDRFVPDFPRGDEITIHDLLVHSSGIQRYVFLPDYTEKERVPQTTKDLVDWIRDKPLQFNPGEGTAYSNANFAMLAHIVERISGQDFGEFLFENIFAPLKLENTGHSINARTIVKNRAAGYTLAGFDGFENARFHDYSVDTGSGSLYSTTGDILKWFNSLRGGKLLKPESRELMFGQLDGPPCYGWARGTSEIGDYLATSGWDGVGFSVRFIHFLKENLTIIVLCNLNVSSLSREIASNLANIALGREHQPFALNAGAISSATAKKISGAYKFGQDFYVPNHEMKIYEEQGRLFIDSEPRGALLQLSDSEFIHRQHWLRVSFELDDKGKVTSMNYGAFEASKLH